MRGVSIGIDIGTAVITTAVVRQDKSGGFRVAAIGKAPAAGIRRGTAVEPQELGYSIKKSVSEAAKASGLKIKNAVAGFSGTGIVSSFSRGVVAISRADVEITGEDVKRVMQAAEALHPKNPNREVIHMAPREYRVDSEWGIKDPIGMVGMRLEVEALILDAQKTGLQNLMKAFNAAGVEIEEWLFSPLAAAEAVLSGRQKESGVMLIDIGGGTSDYAIFEEGGLVDAGVIPIGGDRITHDIAVGFKTHIDVAEAVKLKYGQMFLGPASRRDSVKLAEFVEDDSSVYSQKELSEIIQARMADIFELADKALRQAKGQGRPPAGIVLIGGTAQIPGIREFAKEEMGLPVERGAIQGAAFPEALGPGFDSAAAVGLALWYLRQGGGASYGGRYTPFSKAASGLKDWLRIFLP